MKSNIGRSGRLGVFLAAGVLAASLGGCTYIEVPEEGPEGTQPLSGVELFAIYRDRTWTWDDGAGRFYGDRRRFLAWVSNEQGESFGEGHYILTNAGELCIEATWTNADGSADARSCFLHFHDGEGMIYQKRKGPGDWYVFKHPEPIETDEYNKLVATDDVTERVARIKAELSGN